MAEPRSPELPPELRAESIRLGIGVALAGTLVGPAGAWLYETGQLELFPRDASAQRLARRAVAPSSDSVREEPQCVAVAPGWAVSA